MAKDTFIVRTEWWDAISELQKDEQAEIFRLLFMYHIDEPKINLNNLSNLSIKLVWKLIEPSLKYNRNQYDKRMETSKENGKKGGRPKNLNNLNNHDTVIVSDIDTVSVTDIGSDTILSVVDFLNETCKTQFRAKSKSTTRYINARIKEGFAPEDLKLVIELKNKQWANDEKMRAYLRPSTLFNSEKFEGYLNEAKKMNGVLVAKEARDDSW